MRTTRKVTTEELKSIVFACVDAEKLDKANKACKNVFENLEKYNEEYQKVLALKNEMEHKALMANDEYKENAMLCVTTLTRASVRRLGSVIPRDYENTADFDEFFAKYDKRLDTEARLVSFVTTLQDKFKVVKVTRVKEHVPFSISQIREMIGAFKSGWSCFSTKEELRAAVNRGQLKK